ncbi:hypothetical protein pEaSNUABM13_00268 [Erwinia phage pEa_SNUABM_13]|nr:hypothetical protein pEaSNUABM13_00268 [Erwinia phage pEa_SNUABM_13]
MSKFSEASPEVQKALLATAIISVMPDACKGMSMKKKQRYAAFVFDQIGMTEEDLGNLIDQSLNPAAIEAAAIVDAQEAALHTSQNKFDA